MVDIARTNARPVDQLAEPGDAYERPLVGQVDNNYVSQFFKSDRSGASRGDGLPSAGLDFKRNVLDIRDQFGYTGTYIDLSDGLKQAARDTGGKFAPEFVEQLKASLKEVGVHAREISPRLLEFSQEGSRLKLRGNVNGLLETYEGDVNVARHAQEVLADWQGRRLQRQLGQ